MNWLYYQWVLSNILLGSWQICGDYANDSNMPLPVTVDSYTLQTCLHFLRILIQLLVAYVAQA